MLANRCTNSRLGWKLQYLLPIAAYAITLMVFILAALTAKVESRKAGAKPGISERMRSCLERGDAAHYGSIAAHGYRYDERRRSNVAFFPGLPIVAYLTEHVTGVPSVAAGALVSNSCLLLFLHLLVRYRANGAKNLSACELACILCTFAFCPATFFYRLGFSESLFGLIALCSLYSINRPAGSLWFAAIAAGAATAVRPTGISVSAALACELYMRGEFVYAPKAARATCQVLLSLWGIVAYSLFLWMRFGNPLCFAVTQRHWNMCPTVGITEKAIILLSGEPLWGVVHPSSPEYWKQFCELPAWESLQFANPFYFAAAIVLCFLGWRHRLLTPSEITYVAACLLIPYATRSYEMACSSHARFATAAFPVFIVAGHYLSQYSLCILSAILVVALSMFYIYATRFCEGQLFL